MNNEERRKRPMKKVLAVLCAAIMILGSTMTAFAASVSASDITAASPAELKAAFGVATSEAGDVVFAEVSAEVRTSAINAVVAQIKAKCTILALADGTVPGGKGTITFSVAGVNKGDKIKIGHQKADGSWEFFAADSVGNGTVTATFTSLSPVAIVKVPATFKPTGVGVSTLALLAAAGLAGAVVCKKKSN